MTCIKRSQVFGLLLLATCWWVAAERSLQAQAADAKSARAADDDFFERRIRPVLVEHCYKCHSSDAKELKAGLRLDSRDGLRIGGDSGPAIVPGHPEKSLLIQALRYEGSEMPPDGKLPERVIADFIAWVSAGAPDPRVEAAPANANGGIDWSTARDFWSFQPIQRPVVPEVNDETWPRNAIDRFILSKLESEGLQPIEPAEKPVLLRRLSLTLIGLPPTAEEIDAFVADDSPDAYSRVVERLLSSPQYGERWARHWLDIARYAEDQAHSFKPRLYPNGYRYRDWLVKAFNADMPYDRFVLEQLAADLLDDPERIENLPALGFFACGPVYYGDKLKFDQWDDRIDTLTRGVLGLTVACARCHDHKFDPISTQDYYALAGVFASTEYVEAPLVAPEVVKAYEDAQAKIKELKDDIQGFLETEANRLGVSTKRAEREMSDDLRSILGGLRMQLAELEAKAPAMYAQAHALTDAKEPRDLPVNLRGNPETPGEIVPRRFLRVLSGPHPTQFQQGSGRLELARAMIDPENPLTARVIVNRIWQHHFGRGLVSTPSNFGALGDPPTHPELLDYLAGRLIDSGWSLKAIHREILLSATYRLSSRNDAENSRHDADNRWLWRMNRRRLEVEPWRDAMLMVGGRLDRAMGGPSLDLHDGENHRRTLYAKISRHDLDPLLRMFDFPDPNITSAGRTSTTVALQQLFVLNSPFMVSRARELAARVVDEGEKQDWVYHDDQVQAAYRVALGRMPSDAELSRARAFLQPSTTAQIGGSGASAEGEAARADGEDAPGDVHEKTELSRWEQFAQALLSSNEFLYVD